MTMIDLPKSIVFYTVVVAFALMCVRAVQVLIENAWRGYSVLNIPKPSCQRRVTPWPC